MRFSEYAASLFALEHLVAGTEGKTGRHVEGFGELFIDKIHVSHVEAWKASLAELIEGGDYSPATVNRWLAVLRVIMKAAKRELGLGHLATEGVESFDLSEHETYTEEEPNALMRSVVVGLTPTSTGRRAAAAQPPRPPLAGGRCGKDAATSRVITLIPIFERSFAVSVSPSTAFLG